MVAVYPGGIVIFAIGPYVVWLLIQGFIFLSNELVTWGHLDNDAIHAISKGMKEFAVVFWFFAICAFVMAAAVRLLFQLRSLRGKTPCASSPEADSASQQGHPGVG